MTPSERRLLEAAKILADRIPDARPDDKILDAALDVVRDYEGKTLSPEERLLRDRRKSLYQGEPLDKIPTIVGDSRPLREGFDEKGRRGIFVGKKPVNTKVDSIAKQAGEKFDPREIVVPLPNLQASLDSIEAAANQIVDIFRRARL